VSRDPRLLIGACGWDHPGWNELFYPDDLPLDWRLGFYANEFPLVLVTEREWAQSPTGAAQWCEDSDPSLQFVAQWPMTLPIATAAEKLAPLGERLYGLLLRAEPSQSLSRFKTALAAWGELSVPLCVEFPNGQAGSELQAHLRQHNIGEVWHGEGNTQQMQHGELAIARVDSAQIRDARQLRVWVETSLAVATQRKTLLLFDGEPPSIELMRNAGVICDLL